MISNTALKKAINIAGFFGPVASIIGALFIASGFYWKTTGTDAEQTESIKAIQVDVKEINTKIGKADIFQGVSTAEYNALRDKVSGIEKTVDKIDSKLDKVLIQTK